MGYCDEWSPSVSIMHLHILKQVNHTYFETRANLSKFKPTVSSSITCHTWWFLKQPESWLIAGRLWLNAGNMSLLRGNSRSMLLELSKWTAVKVVTQNLHSSTFQQLLVLITCMIIVNIITSAAKKWAISRRGKYVEFPHGLLRWMEPFCFYLASPHVETSQSYLFRDSS